MNLQGYLHFYMTQQFHSNKVSILKFRKLSLHVPYETAESIFEKESKWVSNSLLGQIALVPIP